MSGVEHLPSPDLTAAVTDAFNQCFGTADPSVARAPGRVNLIGEHTDYNGGLCLPIALPHSAYAAMAPREDDVLRVVSGQTGRWEGTTADLHPRTTGDAAYVLGALWAVREAGVPVGGLDLYVDSQVPIGSGLSSSAALICAAAAVVAGGRLSADDLVSASIRAETEGVGAPTGGLDQTVSILATESHAVLLDFGPGRDRVADQVRWLPESAGHTLLVVDSGVRHSHADGGYGNRRSESEAAAEALGVSTLGLASDLSALDDPVLARRARHVVSEIDRVRRVVAAVGAADWAEVGRLFTASHLSLRDDYEVSCDELDAIVEVALAEGALGARMTGGGFGGSAIVLTPRSEVDRIGEAIVARLTALGTTPRLLHSPASAGATLTV
ncbi:Galactokinase [metagenome]|uniref:Galactokinase n=1 Tax=metagenome TaxID=256318 RepID=A0A2P2C6M7_9ZZZZ